MPKKSKTPPCEPKPLYRRAAPKPPRSRNLQVAPPDRSLKAAATSEFRHPHFLAPSHFTLREDGSIESRAGVPPAPGTGANEDRRDACPTLVFQSDSPFIWLYHGNCLDLLDAIAAKYPEGRFDAIFADPPYFLSAGHTF